MKILDRMERQVRKVAITNLTLYLVIGQGITYFIFLARPDIIDRLVLDHYHVFAGEWWRLLTVVVMPPRANPLFAFMELYILYFMGTALETQWGTARYNLFLLLGYLGTLLAVLVPHAIVSNSFVYSSVLLAFAALYPDFTFMLFFILPVKAKWFALLVWIYYVYALVNGDWGTAVAVAAAIANFVLFFHQELLFTAKTAIRKSRGKMHRERQREQDRQPRHFCATCGINDRSHPKAEFRYCPQCTGTPAYCMEHIHAHVHK